MSAIRRVYGENVSRQGMPRSLRNSTTKKPPLGVYVDHLGLAGRVIGAHVLRVKIGLDGQDVSDLQLAPPFPQGVSSKLPPSAQKLTCRVGCFSRFGFSAGGSGTGAIREKVCRSPSNRNRT